MLEALLARHAAPVLAGMKTANLFSVQGLWLHDLQREIFALTKQSILTASVRYGCSRVEP